MSARPKHAATRLWLVRPLDGDAIIEDAAHLFAGDVAAMCEHIAELHRMTGRQHAATVVE